MTTDRKRCIALIRLMRQAYGDAAPYAERPSVAGIAAAYEAFAAAPSELLAEAGLVRIEDAADRLIATAKARNDRGEWVGGSLWANIREEIARDMRP